MSPVTPTHRPRSRPRAATLARHGDPATVAVTVDPRRLARYRALLHTITTARRDEAAGFDRYWEAVGQVLDGELYVAGGYATAEAFAREVLKEPLRTVQRMVRVARHASPQDEARYGVARLDLALGYIEAKAGGPIRGSLPVRLDKLRIDVPRGGKTVAVLLDDATAADLRAATRALQRRTHRTPARSSPTEQALVQALAKLPGLEAVSVHVSDGKVRLGEVPVFALSALGHALTHFQSAAGDQPGKTAPKGPPRGKPARAKGRKTSR